jgi:ABC-type Mn2+/Zn2+ transport system permease subunit
MIGAPFALGAFVAGLLAAGGMGIVKARTPIREDAVIGVVFTGFFALGLLLISLFPSNINLRSIVFGNILGISDFDIFQTLIISLFSLGVLAFKWKDLMLFCFDPNQARSLGMNTHVLHFTLLTLLSATAVAALQAVGACLVVAMLVTPGATAYLLTDRFSKMLLIASVMGTLTSAVGAYASYYLDGSVGGCIVVLQAALFILALIYAPKHGMLASRKMIRSAAENGGGA